MQILSLSRPILGVCRRVISSPPPPPPRWWPPGLARRCAPPTPMDRLYRPRNVQCNATRVRREKLSKIHSQVPLACAATKCMDTEEMRKPIVEKIWFADIYENSSHRDGAIYRNWSLKREWSEADITDRSETSLEPMMFSEATENCTPDLEICFLHFPRDMLQFLSVRLVDTPVSKGQMQLYGYIAVRDDMDWMLNYVFNHSRDDPIIVQQDSLIQMAGPKRGIEMHPPVLIELDIRIKNGGLEEDDLSLIDGAVACTLRKPWRPINHRIVGNCGTLDMNLAFVRYAVEATIEVIILKVPRGLSLSLSSLIYIVDEYEEIQLFQGTVDQPFSRRFVAAVTMGTEMLLKFKVGKNHMERCLSFEAKQHGCASQGMKLELAAVSVKVTWSTIHLKCSHAC
ncbi:unnamed protein product [Urochloa humidicola]